MHAGKLSATVIAFFAVALCFGFRASAESRALLIGASTYPADVSSLEGPANDVRAVWGLLTERGFKPSNITVLADRLEPSGQAPSGLLAAKCRNLTQDPDCPTFSNITQALDRIVGSAARGDFVVLYFSGHGVQIPDLVKRDEPDGLTEGFAPIDIGRWDSKRQTVQNLITDDIVRTAIERMREKGAFVWAIFDTCHAGDMTRGAASYAVPRLMAGDVLGIPAAAYAEAKQGKTASSRKGSSLGLLKNKRADGLVGFYAAQSDQLALELAFQEQDAQGKPARLIMGGLTNALRRALAQEPNATYRQLAQRITGLYGTFGADMPAPYFEGDLDKPVFSDKAADPVWAAQVQAGRITLSAGELNGVDDGAIVALFESGTGAVSNTPFGYAKVEKATATRSEAQPIAFGDKPAPTLRQGTALRAKLERPGVRAVLRVALPPATDEAAVAPARSGRAAIDTLRSTASDRRPLAVEWVEAGQPADMHVRLRDGRIWLLTSFGDWISSGPRQSASIAVTDLDGTANALRENLWRAARAANLERLAGSYRQSTRGIEGTATKALGVELYLYRDPRPAPGKWACPPEPAAQPAIPKDAVRMTSESLPDLQHCDIVYVVMRNTGKLPVDVTLLYIEAESQIQCFSGWGRARIEPGEVRERVQGFRIVTRDPQSGQPLPIGRESLMIVGVEKPARDAIETTFCHLQQASLDSARSRAGARSVGTPFSELMDQAGLATGNTRGFVAVGPQELGGVSVRTFGWNVKEAK